VFVDGLRDPGMTIARDLRPRADRSHQGPSSSFAGRGTTGGAVNSITKQASTDYSFNRVDLTGVGTDNFWRATLDSNVRLSDRCRRARQSDGAWKDIPNRAPGRPQRFGARSPLLWRIVGQACGCCSTITT
jgi:catecholate siderophore receptor